MFKFIQTSDLHLGAKLGWCGVKAKEHRLNLNKTFEKVLQVAKDKKVDFIFVVGDLFDNPYPDKVLSNYVFSKLEEVADSGIHIVLLPGNHDRLEKGSIFDALQNIHEKIYIFRSENPELIEFDEFNLVLAGHATREQFSTEKGILALKQTLKQRHVSKFKIALFHAGIDIGQQDGKNSVLKKEEIDELGFDYIGLGDWHGLLDVSTKKTKAWFSGSPEILASDQVNAGNVLYVEVDSKIVVEPISLGIITSKQISISVTDSKESSDDIQSSIIKNIAHEENKNMILNVSIIGRRKLEDKIDLEAIEEFYREKFFLLKIQDNTVLKFTKDDLSKYPEELVIGRFIKEVQKDIKKTNDPIQKSILEEVLQEGVYRLTKIQS